MTARREFLKLGMAAAVQPPPGTVPPPPGGRRRAGAAARFPFEEATVAGLGGRMAKGELTSTALTRAYLDRIALVDRGPSGLRSVIETNPDALGIAASLDAERKAGRVRGPLHGLPILVKDNIETGDLMATSAGSLALAKHRARNDAFIVERLRLAGAVVLGKSNLSEWANFRSTKSSSGWSGRGGQCRNPYALDRNPCGSSSGSGAATSANLCVAAIGSETDGSIVCPASGNGLVGIKPTLGLVSRSGIIPIAHSQDTAGPMARTVADAAAVLTALTGVDPRDSATIPSSGRGASDYTSFLDRAGLKGARIGIGRKFFGKDARVDQIMEGVAAAMRDAGAVMVDDCELSPGQEYGDSEFEVLLYEFKADLNAFLATVDPALGIRTMEDVIRFNDENKAKSMPFFGQEIFLQSVKKGGLDSKEYKDALAKNLRASREEGVDKALAKDRLDAILAPTGGPAWLIDLVNGDSFSGVSSSQPPAVAGYPAITVPAGFVSGLPVGMTLMGPAWSEGALIRYAYAFEQATMHRRPPTLARTVPLAEASE
ncbi:MAG TPA: amidase [Vicinamibacteria bacterium]|nr:amidase [Vicinamibacteria bacterium]HRB11876.1 amidase [Vicinamibacteria bacterium]